MIRLLISLVLGGALFAFIAYQMGLIGGGDTPPPPSDDGTETKTTVSAEQLGGNLYKPANTEIAKAPKPLDRLRDPIVIQANMTVMDKLELSTAVPGKILFVGEEMPEGLAQAAGAGFFVCEPFENTSIPGAKDEVTFLFRRFYENELVSGKHMVAKMDPTKIGSELALKVSKVKVAEAQARSAEAGYQEAVSRYQRAYILFQRKVINEEEYGAAVLTKVKFLEDYNTKVKETDQAVTEMEQAQVLYKQHDLISDLGVARVRIAKIYKSRGETVKEQEPIILLQNPDRLMAEALLEPQFRDRVKVGMKVLVDPTTEQAPLRSFRGHRGEITAVAITKDEAPRYLSASEDGTVCAWDQYHKGPVFELLHGDPVRSLAVSPPGAPHNLALTGTTEGGVFLWNLDAADHASPLAEFKKTHRDAVTSVAFSPDGRFFATGSAAGQIRVWSTYKAKREGEPVDTTTIAPEELYTFKNDTVIGDLHRGGITSLTFTPQDLLISAARDNTVRIWELHDKGARAKVKPITGRSGSIAQLGVSADGRLMFLDRGKELQILSAIDGSRVATMENPGGAPFETLALVSPNNELILTAGAAEGRLQLWRAPSFERRARAVREWVTVDRGGVTCAAFSPLAPRGGLHATAVSGSKDGYVYLWALPSAKDVEEHGTYATVTLVSSALDPGSRQVRVGVEVPNNPSPAFPEGRFIPGRPVTIVIE
ncbi:MAG: hypothetical protein U0793_09665 [Gemmataceae bacterium]